MEHLHDAPVRPAGVATLAPETPGRARSQPPPKHVRASIIPGVAPSQPPSERVPAAARPSLVPVSSRPPTLVQSRPQLPATQTPVKNGSASPPPPPIRRSSPPRGCATRAQVPWSGRDAARVSIVKSSTEPGLFYVRLLENGKAPLEGVEGLLVALDPEGMLYP